MKCQVCEAEKDDVAIRRWWNPDGWRSTPICEKCWVLLGGDDDPKEIELWIEPRYAGEDRIYHSLQDAVRDAVIRAVVNGITCRVRLYSDRHEKGVIVATIRGSEFGGGGCLLDILGILGKAD